MGLHSTIGTVAKEFFGYDPQTTNNRMELMAAIQGLLALREPCEVEITTDSEYVRQGITVWVVHWKRRHWWKKYRPVANADLWIELDELTAIHRTNWFWTKGHASNDDNNRCDWPPKTLLAPRPVPFPIPRRTESCTRRSD